MLHQGCGAHDDFEVQRDKFEFPDNFENLSSDSQRAAVVCDMFVNSGFTVEMIKRSLHENNGNVIRILITQRVLRDRRRVYGKSILATERRVRIPAWLIKEPSPAVSKYLPQHKREK